MCGRPCPKTHPCKLCFWAVCVHQLKMSELKVPFGFTDFISQRCGDDGPTSGEGADVLPVRGASTTPYPHLPRPAPPGPWTLYLVAPPHPGPPRGYCAVIATPLVTVVIFCFIQFFSVYGFVRNQTEVQCKHERSTASSLARV